MARIFISYRAADTAPYARIIASTLRDKFHFEAVFYDRTNILPGEPFSDEIRNDLATSEVVLVLIGSAWLNARLNDPADLVYREVAHALALGKNVIPVLFNGTPMPGLSELPDELKPLTQRNSYDFNGKYADRDAAYLAGQVESILLQSRQDRVNQPVNLLHQIRPPVPGFVGRESEINKICEALRMAGRIGLSGLGGIGKSELARAAVGHVLSQFPDAQLWLDLRGTDDTPRPAADALAACIRAFTGIDSKLPDDPDLLVSLYQSQLAGKRVLVVLDNAANEAQVRPLVPPDGCALLVTSRENIALPGLRRLPLEELPLDKAVELFLSIAPDVDRAQAEEIAGLCGYLPLALRAAASLLAVTPDLDPARYVEDLRAIQTRLSRLGTDGVDLSVEASFQLSYARLSEAAASVFRCLSVFPSSFDGAAEEATCNDPGHRNLTELLRRNLVHFDRTTARYKLHDLVRSFAGSRLQPEERERTQIGHAQHFAGVLDRANDLYASGAAGVREGLHTFDLDWANIEAGHSWAAARSAESDTAAQLCSQFVDLPYCLDLRLRPQERIPWFEAALAAARRLGDRRAEGVAVGNLGLSYGEMNESQRAIEYYEQHLVIARELNDRKGESIDYGNMGNAYAALGETRKAIEYHEQNLSLSREIGYRRGEGNALGNLGIAYDRLGEPARALDYHGQNLAIARDIGDLRAEANALWNSSIVLDTVGRNPEAITYAEDALRIYDQIGDPMGEKPRRWLKQVRESGASA